MSVQVIPINSYHLMYGVLSKAYTLRKKCYNDVQGSKLRKKITFPSEMLQKILPFRPNVNLSDRQTSAF